MSVYEHSEYDELDGTIESWIPLCEAMDSFDEDLSFDLLRDYNLQSLKIATFDRTIENWLTLGDSKRQLTYLSERLVLAIGVLGLLILSVTWYIFHKRRA